MTSGSIAAIGAAQTMVVAGGSKIRSPSSLCFSYHELVPERRLVIGRVHVLAVLRLCKIAHTLFVQCGHFAHGQDLARREIRVLSPVCDSFLEIPVWFQTFVQTDKICFKTDAVGHRRTGPQSDLVEVISVH